MRFPRSPAASSVAMASRLNVGALLVVLVLVICITFAGQTDATKCSREYRTCNGSSECEINVWSDVSNCGDCGVSCPRSIPHAYSECKKGNCMFDCKKGYGNCDGNITNGCETSLTSPDHCGSCWKVCPAPSINGTATCHEGECGFKCDPGFSQCRRGCHDLQSDKDNCGRCGHVCKDQHMVGNDSASDLVGFCFHGHCKLQLQCFPGDATVRLEYGEVKQMTDLELGDKVAVMKPDGSIAYEDVYVFGHRDASVISSFLRLTLKPIDAEVSDPAVDTRNLELTALHFVPISAAAGNVMYKRAQDVTKGDKMWVQGASVGSSTLFTVTSISHVTKQGLYNPYTLGGTIIVNGVVASSHSEWFLDDLFQALHLVHWLPAVYQMVLLPVRIVYNGLGKELYVSIYQRIDAQVDVSRVGTKYGGSVVATAGAASAALAILMFRVMPKKA